VVVVVLEESFIESESGYLGTCNPSMEGGVGLSVEGYVEGVCVAGGVGVGVGVGFGVGVGGGFARFLAKDTETEAKQNLQCDHFDFEGGVAKMQVRLKGGVAKMQLRRLKTKNIFVFLF